LVPEWDGRGRFIEPQSWESAWGGNSVNEKVEFLPQLIPTIIKLPNNYSVFKGGGFDVPGLYRTASRRWIWWPATAQLVILPNNANLLID
jgi:hypothetical protein